MLSKKQKALAIAILRSTRQDNPFNLSKRGTLLRIAAACRHFDANFDLPAFLQVAGWDNSGHPSRTGNSIGRWDITDPALLHHLGLD